MKPLLLLLLLSLLCAGCEEIVDDDDLPYTPRLVVRGILETGRPVDSIFFMRTLPLDEEFRQEDGVLNDVMARIEVDGERYPLRLIDGGLYQAPELIVQPGKLYRLVAEWRGKRIEASTLAPYQIAIDSVGGEFSRDSNNVVDSSLYQINAFIHPVGTTVYTLAYRAVEHRKNGGLREVEYAPNWLVSDGSDVDSAGQVRISDLYFRFDEDSTFIPGTAILIAYDHPYLDYWLSSHRYDDQIPRDLSDKLFATGHETIRWNVRGDGVGMFIARSRTERKLP